MKVLIVGGGGREHALAWKVASSERVSSVHVAPGNAGTHRSQRNGCPIENVDIGAEDIPALLKFAQDNAVGLTIVGPEAPLVAGIVDTFQAAGLKIFGPTAAAAQLEGSKAFSKDFLQRHGIPTAAYRSFSNAGEAIAWIKTRELPIVIKADGLAAGKGVVMVETLESAEAVVNDMLSGNRFGEAGSRIVVEQFLTGEEASFICVVDGGRAQPLATSQDHKARDDGDSGPNTGGMGAYSPAPVVTAGVHQHIIRDIIEPTVKGMAKDGHPFVGFLYAGLMIDDHGRASVIEFNVRLGDPEAQVLLMRLDSDLVDLCEAATEGRLGEVSTDWLDDAAVGVVMAAGGYPDGYRKGDLIDGLHSSDTDNPVVFHAGTVSLDNGVATNGGRVLCVTARAGTIGEARELAYRRVAEIHWQDAYYRTDIAHRALARGL